MKVYLLHHVVDYGDDGDDWKLLGVFSEHAKAVEAIEDFRCQKGFKENPELFDPVEDDLESGFCVSEYTLNKASAFWSEGFGAE